MHRPSFLVQALTPKPSRTGPPRKIGSSESILWPRPNEDVAHRLLHCLREIFGEGYTMNTLTRFTTVGLAGCLCSTLLYALAPGQLAAGDRPPHHRHSLITRPEVTAAQAKAPETSRAPKIPEKVKPLSLLAPRTPIDSTNLSQPQTSQPAPSVAPIASSTVTTPSKQTRRQGSACSAPRCFPQEA